MTSRISGQVRASPAIYLASMKAHCRIVSYMLDDLARSPLRCLNEFTLDPFLCPHHKATKFVIVGHDNGLFAEPQSPPNLLSATSLLVLPAQAAVPEVYWFCCYGRCAVENHKIAIFGDINSELPSSKVASQEASRCVRGLICNSAIFRRITSW